MIKILRWCARIGGILALVLGLMIGRVSFGGLVRAHMVLGLVVVVALALIAVCGFLARIPAVLAIVGLAWAGGTLYLGVAQNNFMPGDAHWVIEVVHALLGIGAIGLADAIGGKVSRA
jgi:hypothetical protein